MDEKDLTRRKILQQLSAACLTTVLPGIAALSGIADYRRNNCTKWVITKGLRYGFPIAYQPGYIEFVGSDKNGSLLPEFDAAMVCSAISRTNGISVEPKQLHGFDRITGCGLCNLWVIRDGNVKRHALWNLLQDM